MTISISHQRTNNVMERCNWDFSNLFDCRKEVQWPDVPTDFDDWTAKKNRQRKQAGTSYSIHIIKGLMHVHVLSRVSVTYMIFYVHEDVIYIMRVCTVQYRMTAHKARAYQGYFDRIHIIKGLMHGHVLGRVSAPCMTIYVHADVLYVGPHFGTVPVPALVIQFRNWNTQVPKSASCQNGAPSARTGQPSAGTGLGVILPFTQFRNWAPSSRTGVHT